MITAPISDNKVQVAAKVYQQIPSETMMKSRLDLTLEEATAPSNGSFFFVAAAARAADPAFVS
jgi:hypothetical protein